MHDHFPDKLVFIDMEMTATWPPVGEIIELGAVIADTNNLGIVDRLNIKIIPTHIATADPAALKINGYRADDWSDAVPLKQALQIFLAKASGAAFCAWRVAFDFAFFQAACYDTGLLPAGRFTTQVCVYSMALQALKGKPIQPFRLKTVAQYFGIPPEPEPHRAVNGAEQAFEIYRKLVAAKN
jgi:DNA polymerase III subunit epsilon